ncbi:hypothetical protein DPMN_032102 [Dreissena polymorpha]|uniref:Uncharacterized protein n=1 Tax=Dreissena polymorpha TaxID=45954 RepID=A0A9D4M4C7_DREPO|nr:hypothetical protein DPMN_032102 [Dreissena polymorpha]
MADGGIGRDGSESDYYWGLTRMNEGDNDTIIVIPGVVCLEDFNADTNSKEMTIRASIAHSDNLLWFNMMITELEMVMLMNTYQRLYDYKLEDGLLQTIQNRSFKCGS